MQKRIFLILMLSFVISACANSLIYSKVDYKNKVSSKRVSLKGNYQKLVHCYNEDFYKFPENSRMFPSRIEVLDEIGIAEWSANTFSTNYIAALIEFKKIENEKTEVTFYAHKTGDEQLTLSMIESRLNKCSASVH